MHSGHFCLSAKNHSLAFLNADSARFQSPPIPAPVSGEPWDAAHPSCILTEAMRTLCRIPNIPRGSPPFHIFQPDRPLSRRCLPTSAWKQCSTIIKNVAFEARRCLRPMLHHLQATCFYFWASVSLAVKWRWIPTSQGSCEDRESGNIKTWHWWGPQR